MTSTPTSVRPARRTLARFRSAPVHVIVWLYAAALALPLYFLIVSSFKDNTEIFQNGFGLPTTWHFDNFAVAWEKVELGTALVNSAIVTVLTLVFLVIVVVPASYGLARSTGVIGRLIERSFALGFLVPGFASIVPTVLLAIALGLYQTKTFLVLNYVAAAVPLSVILVTQYMRAIPHELDESARIDGANRLQILLRIYLPLVAPVLATVLLVNFINVWNEYLIALVIAGPSAEARTVQVALPILITRVSAQYGLLAAGSLITLVPVYLVYALLRRRMEDALISGATKG